MSRELYIYLLKHLIVETESLVHTRSRSFFALFGLIDRSWPMDVIHHSPNSY